MRRDRARSLRALREPDQGDDLRSSTMELMAARATRTSACRVFKDNAGVIAFDDDRRGLLQGRDAQPSQRHRAVRRQRNRRRRRASATSWAPAWPPSRSRTRTSSASRYPTLADASNAPAAGRHPPQAHPPAGRRRRARLRQPHGHPDRQRRGLLRRPLHRQPAGLLRLRRADPARQDRQGSASPATRSSSWAGAPGATASTARRSHRPS